MYCRVSNIALPNYEHVSFISFILFFSLLHSWDAPACWVGQGSRSHKGQWSLLLFLLLYTYPFFNSHQTWYSICLYYGNLIHMTFRPRSSQGHIRFLATVPIPFNRFSLNLVWYKCKVLQLILWSWVCMTLWYMCKALQLILWPWECMTLRSRSCTFEGHTRYNVLGFCALTTELIFIEHGMEYV